MVALCAARGIRVSSIPGPVASITALTLSGLPTSRFCFEGFLSVNKSDRRAHLNSLKNETRTMLFHEAPHKLRTTLKDLSAAFGESRRIALCRELTKLNEEVLRMTLGEALSYYEEKEPRGEYVLVVEGTSESASLISEQEVDIPTHVKRYMDTGMSKMDAIKQTAKDRGVHKNEIYQKMLEQ